MCRCPNGTHSDMLALLLSNGNPGSHCLFLCILSRFLYVPWPFYDAQDYSIALSVQYQATRDPDRDCGRGLAVLAKYKSLVF